MDKQWPSLFECPCGVGLAKWNNQQGSFECNNQSCGIVMVKLADQETAGIWRNDRPITPRITIDQAWLSYRKIAATESQ